MNEKTKSLLTERNKVYGNYYIGCNYRFKIMSLINELHFCHNGCNLHGINTEYIRDIVNKLCRVAVTPDHIDSWKDIAGYAELVVEILEKEKQDADK